MVKRSKKEILAERFENIKDSWIIQFTLWLFHHKVITATVITATMWYSSFVNGRELKNTHVEIDFLREQKSFIKDTLAEAKTQIRFLQAVTESKYFSLRTFPDIAWDVKLGKDGEWRFVYVNPSFEKEFGVKNWQLSGRKLKDVYGDSLGGIYIDGNNKAVELWALSRKVDPYPDTVGVRLLASKWPYRDDNLDTMLRGYALKIPELAKDVDQMPEYEVIVIDLDRSESAIDTLNINDD